MIRFANLTPMQNLISRCSRKYLTVNIMLLFVFFTHTIWAQRAFSDLNIAYHFNIMGETKVDHRTFFDNDSIRIYIRLLLNEPDSTADLFDIFTISWYIQNSYSEEQILLKGTLNPGNLLGHDASKWFLYLSIPARPPGKLMVIRLNKKGSDRKYSYDINLDETLNFPNADLLLYPAKGNLPLITHFINETDTIRIKSISDYNGPLFAYYYDKEFGPAKPPMVIEKRKVVKELEVTEIIKIEPDQPVRLAKRGFYFIQKDTTSLDGITIRVEDAYFPLFKTMDKIILPLVYISTGTETKTIRQAADPMAAFEAYWLKLSKSPDLASATIKKFYFSAETSNFYFTNYKEGWKTDPGMIYLIFGQPDEVYKGKETMDWIYNRNLSLPIIRFTFLKIRNIFADDHYSLMRKKNYDRVWFKAVELWRQGKK